jgi:hypothetical protein
MACVKCFTLACRDNAEAEPPALTPPKRSRCSIFHSYANAVTVRMRVDGGFTARLRQVLRRALRHRLARGPE